MSETGALQLANALLALTREERTLVEGGRLEELTDLCARRAAVMAQLDRVLPRPVPPDLAPVLAEVRAEAERNLSQLRVAQDEISRELAGDAARSRALTSYTR